MGGKWLSRSRRQSNVIWFNPPYSKNVKNNIARDFLLFLDNYFPPTHKLNSIFNRHTVCISYSCTGSMKSFLDKHSKIILKKHTNRLNKDDEKLCNCRQRVNCPTNGKCLTRSVDYKAEVTSTLDNTTQTYIGVTAEDFKTRYRNHLKSLRNENYKHKTELSKHVWNLKKRKPAIFNQMGHHQANTSWKKRKTKLRCVPRGEADDHERPFKEHS